ncbi:hypothetical protein SNEBB_003332 [Seison nebaliae]|nr:hypothetical protein SNEBB_003332 [Seison nebaliae]
MKFFRKIFPQNENNCAANSRAGSESVRSHTKYHDFAMRKTLWNFLSHCLHDVDNRTNIKSKNFDQMQIIQNILFDDVREMETSKLSVKDNPMTTKEACFGYDSHSCRVLTLLNRQKCDITIDRSKCKPLPPKIKGRVENGSADFTVRFRKMEDPLIENEIIQAAYRLRTNTLLEVKQHAKILVSKILIQHLTKPGALAGTGVLRIRLKGSEKFFILPCRYFQHVSLGDVPPEIFGKKPAKSLNADDLRYHSISYGWNFNTKSIEPCVQTPKNLKTTVPFSNFNLNEKTTQNLSFVRPSRAASVRSFQSQSLRIPSTHQIKKK